jgi:hypothetical protein
MPDSLVPPGLLQQLHCSCECTNPKKKKNTRRKRKKSKRVNDSTYMPACKSRPSPLWVFLNYGLIKQNPKSLSQVRRISSDRLHPSHLLRRHGHRHRRR